MPRSSLNLVPNANATITAIAMAIIALGMVMMVAVTKMMTASAAKVIAAAKTRANIKAEWPTNGRFNTAAIIERCIGGFKSHASSLTRQEPTIALKIAKTYNGPTLILMWEPPDSENQSYY
jgi:uncharacterized protein (UPF0371 family)